MATDLKHYFEFSDDENEQEQTAEQTLMPFGKYKGQTLKHIVSFSLETREYIKFCLTLDLNDSLRTHITTLLSRQDLLPPMVTFQMACLTIIPFGQYKGTSLEDLVRYSSTRGYLLNLLKWEKLSVILREHINVVLNEYHKLKHQME